MTGFPLARTGTPRLSPAVCLKRNPAHRALVEMGLNLNDQRFRLIPFDDKGFIESRQFAGLKGDVDDRAAHCNDLTRSVRRVRHCDPGRARLPL